MPSRSAQLVAAIVAGPILLIVALTATLLGVATISGSASACTKDTGQGVQPGASRDARSIPSAYLALYQQAGRRYGIAWNVLAAVGKIESDHGRDPTSRHDNSAGAGGPMQFLAPTWAQYGVDGNNDGKKDRYDAADAIPGAANYLRASGAPQKMRKALFAYNHAWWYVDKVMAQAARYASGDYTTTPSVLDVACQSTGPGGFILPPKGKGASGNWPPESPGGPDGITPRTRTVRDLVKQMFHVQFTIGCLRPGDPKDHGKGRACDFMLSNEGAWPSATEVQRGYDIANWATANADRYGIRYVIYRQRIWNIERAGQGWRLMGDRGSLTQNHFDHVHISIY